MKSYKKPDPPEDQTPPSTPPPTQPTRESLEIKT